MIEYRGQNGSERRAPEPDVGKIIEFFFLRFFKIRPEGFSDPVLVLVQGIGHGRRFAQVEIRILDLICGL